MKKIFLTLVLIFAFNLPLYAATEFTIETGAVSSDVIIPDSITYSDDVTSDDVTEYFYSLTGNYKFPTIADALLFANSPEDYLTAKKTSATDEATISGDIPDLSEITLKLGSGYSSANNVIGDDIINFNNYPRISTVEISPSSGTISLYVPGTAERHFNFDGGPSVTLKNLTFEGTSNNAKGGILVGGGEVTFDSVKFQKIDMSGSDGGAANITGGTATFTSCTFENDTAENGGGVNITGGTVTFDGSTEFKNNTANLSGGALFVKGGTVTLASGVTFSGNTATTYGGGAILQFLVIRMKFIQMILNKSK